MCRKVDTEIAAIYRNLFSKGLKLKEGEFAFNKEQIWTFFATIWDQ